jgi:FkbM family methyltransferase
MTLNFSGIRRSSWLGRVLRLPLALIPARARLPVLQGLLRGAWWTVGASTHGCWLGSYEHAQQLAFAALVRPGDTVFDVGAHAGFYTLLAARLVGSRGRVVAFEPMPENLRYLRHHLAMNRVTGVRVVAAAVAAAAGRQRIARGPTGSMWHLHEDGGHEVTTVALDPLLRAGELPLPAVIKMDIEGAEVAALAGATWLLREHPPRFMLSTHGHAAHVACCSVLREAGYDLRPVGDLPLERARELVALPPPRDSPAQRA